MIYARNLIEDVARFLADYDVAGEQADQYVTWSQLDLLSYFRLAVLRVMSADPKAFTKRITTTIPADGILQLPHECEECSGVLTHTSTTGKVTIKPNFTARTPFIVGRPVCSSGSARVSIMRDEQDRRTLFVTPAGTGGTLTLTCTQSPSVGDISAGVDIPAKYEPVIFDFMVADAFGTEVESSPMRARSDEHRKRAMEMLAVTAPTPDARRKK
jgi:hypothetical protein